MNNSDNVNNNNDNNNGNNNDNKKNNDDDENPNDNNNNNDGHNDNKNDDDNSKNNDDNDKDDNGTNIANGNGNGNDTNGTKLPDCCTISVPFTHKDLCFYENIHFCFHNWICNTHASPPPGSISNIYGIQNYIDQVEFLRYLLVNFRAIR